MRTSRGQRNYTATIAQNAAQSEVIDIEDAVAGGYVLPAAFTNTGATNLLRFGVTNGHQQNGTPLIALLPSTTIATAQTQRGTVTLNYPLPPDVFKFRQFRFDGTANEAVAASIACTFKLAPVRWDTRVATIGAAASNSDNINIAQAIGGSVQIPAVFTGTTVTFQVSLTGVSWSAVPTTADAAIAQGVAADRHVPIPDGAFGFPWLRITSNASEGALRYLTVTLKR